MDLHHFLAFDLGAESGRSVVGTLRDGQLSLEEIHRFPNEPVEVCETLHWDVLALYSNVLKGIREYVARFGDSVDGVGIDTWGVDFGLLDRDGNLLQNPVHYRDRRSQGMADELSRRMPHQELFRCTGMPVTPVNTSLQLLALRVKQPALLHPAGTFLMMPDLLNYFLTGQKFCERTNAVSTQLYDPLKHQWSEESFRKLDLPLRIMPELRDPGTIMGELSESVRKNVGLKCGVVIAPCTHDTASAVAAVPGSGEDWAFLSSGTWSVLGALTDKVFTSQEAFAAGVCNELTLRNSFLCRNIMGLWLLQQVRAAWRKKGDGYSYEDLVSLAERVSEATALIDPDDPSFYAPEDMTQTIRQYCTRTRQPQPEKPGDVVRCILASLALSYRHRLDQLAKLLGRPFRALNVVGGGSRNSLLCQLTADATGLRVEAGPVEATVMGNVLVQALAIGAVKSPGDVRDLVRASSTLVEYEPRDRAVWEERYGSYVRLLNSSAKEVLRPAERADHSSRSEAPNAGSSGECHDCKSSFWRLLADLRKLC